MSRKSRERREKNKTVRPDDYFSNGTFEMARFGKNTIVRNNRTPEQHAAQMEYLRAEYASKYEDIAQKVKSLKEKVTQCDPYSLLMYLRSLATMGQMNIFSEIEYSSDANAIIRAQEYVQSILVSTDNNYVPSSPSEEAALHAQIVADFDELYKDFRFFYHFWAAHIQKSGKIANHAPAQFYDHEKNPTFLLPGLDTFDDVFTFSVTVDNFNEFAAKAEKLSIISLKEETIVISYDDLLAYAGYFDEPIRFLHYLKQRKAAMRVPQYQMYDEFDHLGLYIDRNLYALDPSQYGDVKNVIWQGFRQSLDEYFNLLFANPSAAKKPTQNMPEQISEIIEYLGYDVSPEKIRLAHYLMDLASVAKEDLAGQIKYALKRQRELKRAVPLAAFGDIKYCTFISMPGIIQYPIQEQLDYAYAAASRNEEIPVMWISLEYDNKKRLVSAKGKKCFFSDLEGDDIERIRHMGREKARDWVLQYKMTHGKIGRNDYCPCGSGKKYKFCCIEIQ